MVHISELGAGRRVTHPNEVLNAGDEVAATVLSIDLEKRRIALSLDPARQGTAEPGHQAADYAKPSQGMGTLATCCVKPWPGRRTTEDQAATVTDRCGWQAEH